MALPTFFQKVFETYNNTPIVKTAKSILSNSTDVLVKTNTSSYAMLSGGTNSGSGANIILAGKDKASYGGEFWVTATDGTNTKVLKGKPDGSLTWKDKRLDFPVGTQILYAGASVPEGFLLCDGSSFSASDYPELATVLGGTTLPNYTVGKGLSGTVPVFGNGYSLGLTDGTHIGSLFRKASSWNFVACDKYGMPAGTSTNASGELTADKSNGVVTKALAGENPEYSGLVADFSPVGSLNVYIKY